jgi:glycosyltransferase involved in cell wall biosynthesis
MNKIGIITICFNNIEELKATCNSVDLQQTAPYEHLVIDGSTNDDIKNYLQQQHQQPSYRRSIHEKDHGISDAFNKGIKNATGDIILLLNSGDQLLGKDVIQIVANAFKELPGINWLHSKYQTYRGGKWVTIGKPHEAEKIYRGMRSICHQTMFVRKELYEKYGMFDTSLKIGMDYDFLLRIKDEPFLFLSNPLVIYSPSGISSLQYLESLEETSKIYTRKFGNTLLHRIWITRLKILHYLLKSPIGNFLYKIKVWLKLENV